MFSRRSFQRVPKVSPPRAYFIRSESTSTKSNMSSLTKDEITASLKSDGRQRLTRFWIPTGGIAEKETEADESHSLLVKGGFLRQAYSGVFHLLPLGLRVQEKLESVIDKHMRSLGASKVSLSSISSEDLWRKTGRLENKELLRLKDRRESGFLLGPTHEEEITQLVAGTVKSYKELPLRLYQVSRKYRDELRPRQGLLRAKEFLMKDMYTFDHEEALAYKTYDSVRQAYANILAELKIPYLVAQADSGAIGGDLSHEYHFISDKGEDTVFACNSCDYVANEEVAEAKAIQWSKPGHVHIWKGISKDRKTLVEVHVMPDPEGPQEFENPLDLINIHGIKAIFPDLDTAIEKDAERLWLAHQDQSPNAQDHTIFRILDHNVAHFSAAPPPPTTPDIPVQTHTPDDLTTPRTRLHRLHTNSPCPSCTAGTVRSHRAVEVGHTFHLGTRYSAPLHATVQGPSGRPTLVSMGCHGIGVSRMIGAVAAILADARGLNWPRAMAPFEVVVVPGKGVEGEAGGVYDRLVGAEGGEGGRLDVVLDDRAVGMGWKLQDADLIGYNVIVALGRKWKSERKCEVQCRRLGVKEDVGVDELRVFVKELLEKL